MIRTINIKPLILHCFLWVIAISFTFNIANAQPPSGYYNSANGLSSSALKTALYNIINNHTVISYNGLWTAYQTTDDKANGKVWDMYSDIPGATPPYEFTFVTDQCGNYTSEGDCYNREHSFPQSWFNESSPMVSDLFHIYPTDGKVNGERNSYPFGIVNNPSWTSLNGSKKGPSASATYTGTVFEPIDSFKGDFARSYFYMATRYENLISTWQYNGTANEILDGTSFPCFDQWFLDVLIAWHTADPVSQKEIDRNNTIYSNFQHNRNPYIDHPEYVNQIWGGVLPEPTNYPANFSARNIHLQWTDATGTVLPEHYLILMSTTGFSSIPIPVDGTFYPDSATGLNVDYGVQNAYFRNLNPNTTYYFKLFGYNLNGTSPDYKTDGNIPQMSKIVQ